jgi:hypothetical protein
MQAMTMQALAQRISAATPPGRDRGVDGLRAIGVLGVVLGHWLVTALVLRDGVLRSSSPLHFQHALVPVSWLFQTLAVFFLVGGMVVRPGPRYGPWLSDRMSRLFRPVITLVALWAVIMLIVPAAPLRLVLTPLWFLVVFAVLTAAAPLLRRLHPAWPLVTVALVDLVRLGLDGPAWLGWVNVAAGWAVPFSLGMAWAQGRLFSRATLWILLVGGAAATVMLVRWCGYPASMVGVPGDGFSNLDPPSLAAVTFGLAQCGAAGLMLAPLRRMLARPTAWAPVALANLHAMPVFLWHQTAMIAVTAVPLATGRLVPGLHTTPDGPGWIGARLAWLPAFAAVLAVFCVAVQQLERRVPALRSP